MTNKLTLPGVAMQRLYLVDGYRQTAGSLWDGYVGNQSPSEFRANTNPDGIPQLVADYVDGLGDIMPEAAADLTDSDRSQLVAALTDYLMADVEREWEAWESSRG